MYNSLHRVATKPPLGPLFSGNFKVQMLIGNEGETKGKEKSLFSGQ